jgi:NADH-quinone oxidoreductase subunit M
MYFIIAIWGGQRRSYAAIKFIIYTLIGSVLMFLGILTLYFQHSCSSDPASTFAELMRTQVPVAAMVGVLGVLRGLRRQGAHVPVPHLAAGRAHRSAHGRLRDPGQRPVEDGDIRIPALLAAAAAGCGQEPTVVTDDGGALHHRHRVRRAGFADAEGLEEAGGLFVGEPPGVLHAGHFRAEPGGISGSIIQQINHGISTGMLFLIVGVVYERRHTREISEYGGLMKVMPIFTLVFGLAALSSMGMPPLNGFIGEITICRARTRCPSMWAFWGAVGIALGAAYLLWLFQRTMLGEVSEKNAEAEAISPGARSPCSRRWWCGPSGSA